MDSDSLAERTLRLYRFLDAHRALFEAHSVDFFTEDHWNTAVPEEWRSLADFLPPDEVFLFPERHGHSASGEPLIM